MKHNPQKIVEMFEESMAEYTGSKYAVAVDNCTNAIKICCKHLKVKEVNIPYNTYVSVAQSILQAGGSVKFRKEEWSGIYQLNPYPIYDAAKRLTSDMYIPSTLMCLSFGIKKPLHIGKGGMILTDDKSSYESLKRLRWSGRTEGLSYFNDLIEDDGYNSYFTPEWAARGLMLLSVYPTTAPDQKEAPDYRDIREFNFIQKKHERINQDR